jgi:PKD repeat protein
MYDRLRFFKGFDYDLNLVKNSDGIWQGNVYLEEVSAGLYETLNLFLLEEVAYYHNNQAAEALQPSLVKPFEDSTGSSLVCKWIDNKSSSQDIILYDAEVKKGQPVVTHKKKLDLELQQKSTVSFIEEDGLKSFQKSDFDSLSKEALQVNITINSDQEGPHRRVLGIYDSYNGTETLVAKIAFYGEVVAEDERLKVLLQNLGATLNEGDFLLFKEHDISEQAVDYKLLNRKRKELLLELHNIKPFVGTYKALLNAIDFFGYNNITLKEYWINVDKTKPSFGKLYAVPVPNSSVRGEQLRKKLTVQIPSNSMKKTSRFSLVYRLNEPNGEIDEFGIPKVDEVFDFTPDEVLIKLYGLKEKLKREYLPLKSRIVDITAEGDFFTQKKLSVWNIQNGIRLFNEGHEIEFKAEPESRTLFVEDMALVLGSILDTEDPTYQKYINLEPSDYANLTVNELEEIKAIFNQFYDSYTERDLSTFNRDIPVASPVILNGQDSFKDTWDSATYIWDDLVDPNQNLLVTWDNWWKKWVYELEWVVKGPRGFNFETRGNIEDYLSVPLILPYAGGYDVEMRTYDLFGQRSHRRIKDFIQVELKEVELYGVYRWLEQTRFNDKNLTWDKSGGYWEEPQDNELTVEDAIASLYLTLDRANYLHDESQGIEFSMVRRYMDPLSETGFSETKGPYQWDQSKFRWIDTQHNWWDATRVGSDLAASFKVHDIENGDLITIKFKDPITHVVSNGSHIITSPTPSASVNTQQYENEWKAIRDELNASEDPIISKFNWNPVFYDTNDDGLPDTFLYMLAVGKQYSKNYDFEQIVVTPNGSSSIRVDGEQHVVHYNPGFDKTRMFKSYASVERSTHVTIASDMTNMPGIKNPKWTIINKNKPEKSDIYYNSMWLTYIFQEPGSYEIGLEVEDTNGNQNMVKRNMINVK